MLKYIGPRFILREMGKWNVVITDINLCGYSWLGIGSIWSTWSEDFMLQVRVIQSQFSQGQTILGSDRLDLDQEIIVSHAIK